MSLPPSAVDLWDECLLLCTGGRPSPNVHSCHSTIVYACTGSNIHTYCTHLHTCSHTHTYTHAIHIYTYSCTYTLTHTYTSIHIYTLIYAHMLTHTFTHIHTHILTNIHTHLLTHTCYQVNGERGLQQDEQTRHRHRQGIKLNDHYIIYKVLQTMSSVVSLFCVGLGFPPILFSCAYFLFFAQTCLDDFGSIRSIAEHVTTLAPP